MHKSAVCVIASVSACLLMTFTTLPASAAAPDNARLQPLYHLTFEDQAGKPTLTNTGSIGGAATVDIIDGNKNKTPDLKFTADTPDHSAQAATFPTGSNAWFGPALVLPDSADKLRLSHAGDAMTVTAWVKWNGSGADHKSTRGIAGKETKAGGWVWYITPQGALRFEYHPASDASKTYARWTKAAITPGKWHHVSLVVDTGASYPKGIRFFIDGQPAALTMGIAGHTIAPGGAPIVVGANFPSNGRALDGSLDDVRFYDKALSLKQIAAAIPSVTLEPIRIAEYISESKTGHRTLDLQQLINATTARDGDRVTLPAGRFYLAGKGARLIGLKNFTLEGAGAEQTTLITGMWDGTTVQVDHCDHVTLRGFSVDRDPVPFVQGTVTDISEQAGGNLVIKFTTHEGYPKLTDKVMAHVYGTTVFYDSHTRKLVKHGHWFGATADGNLKRIDLTHGQFTLGSRWKPYVKVGDFVVMRNGSGVPFRLFNSDSVRMEDITVYASSSIAVAARFLTGDNYFSYDIKRGPTPAGATQARLASTDADGMQYFFSPGSVTFENCDFGFMGDDGINISGIGLTVVKVQSPTKVTVVSRTASWILKRLAQISRPGDTIRALRYGTFEPLGDLPLKSMTFDAYKKPEHLPAFFDKHDTGLARRPKLDYLTVTLAKAPRKPIRVGDVVVPRKSLPEHFTIRNCRFHDTRARGLLIMGSNGVIENNTIENTYLAGIAMGNELPTGAPGWIANVVVRNNVVRNTCLDDIVCLGSDSHYVGAIQLCNRPIAINEPLGEYPWFTGHHNVKINGNTIEGCAVAGIFVNGLDGGEVVGNTVRRTQLGGGAKVGNDVGLTAPWAITIMNSKDVKVADNTISDLGPYAANQGAAKNIGTYPPRSKPSPTPE